MLLAYLNAAHLAENIHTDMIPEMDYGRLVWENKDIFPRKCMLEVSIVF